MSKQRKNGEVFACVVLEVEVRDYPLVKPYKDYKYTYHLTGSPPLCPDYIHVVSQWGIVLSTTPIEQGSVVILKVLDAGNEYFELVSDGQET